MQPVEQRLGEMKAHVPESAGDEHNRIRVEPFRCARERVFDGLISFEEALARPYGDAGTWQPGGKFAHKGLDSRGFVVDIDMRARQRVERARPEGGDTVHGVTG